MCQDNCNTKREKGEHLTYKDRVKIEHLYNQQDKNFAEIGRELNCDRTTVSREVKKGTIEIRDYEWRIIEVYSPEKGQEVYDHNSTGKGPNLKIGTNDELAKFIEKRIKAHKSPAAVAQI